MKTAPNRVLMAFKTWEQRHKELDPLLRSAMTDAPTLARLQLDHLRQAVHRLRNNLRPDEAPFMRLLHNQVARLENQLYPNRLARLFFRLKDRFIDGPAYIARVQQQREHNLAQLKAQLKEAGLGSFAGKLEEHLDPDQRQARIPLDCQLGPEKRLTLDLHFGKDHNGDFKLEKIGSALQEKGGTGKSQEFTLTDWPGLKTNQVLSLLEGRALRQQFTDASGHQNQRWVELGPKGVQHYDPDYGFDIRTALDALPAITRNKEELVRYLENGQQVPTYWKQGRNFQNIHVQADPANRCIRLLDDRFRQVTAEQLNRNLLKQGPKVKTLGVPTPKLRKEVKHALR